MPLSALPFDGVIALGAWLLLLANGVWAAVTERKLRPMALTLGVHNVPEAMVLTSMLARRGASRVRTTALSVGVNVAQVVLAAVSFALVSTSAGLLPWLAGFAVGALIYRTLVELLPESYHQAGQTSIAMVTLLAAGMVVLLAGVAQ